MKCLADLAMMSERDYVAYSLCSHLYCFIP
jgi:hypothetical protein